MGAFGLTFFLFLVWLVVRRVENIDHVHDGEPCYLCHVPIKWDGSVTNPVHPDKRGWWVHNPGGLYGEKPLHHAAIPPYVPYTGS